MKNLALAACAGLLTGGLTLAQTPHHQFHDVYEEWKTIKGASCCNNNDCVGAAGFRRGPEGYEVLIEGQYFPVPADAVRPYPTPDGKAHVCFTHGYLDGKYAPEIICFVRPTEV